MQICLPLILLQLLTAIVLAKNGNSFDEISGSMDDMKHIIIFMQENRPFDHYFGTLKGVRGFNDRTTSPMKSGFNAFFQPINQSDLSMYMLPFRVDPRRTNTMCMPAPEMYYPTDLKIWNYGRMDAWNTARDSGYGMSYFTRADLPYYYALYDNFVVGDHYFQSTFTCTNPNRMHLFTGSNGLSVGQDAVLENDEPKPGYDWITMGELLENANISWKVYQQADNFDDNAFAWFANYFQSRPGDALFEKGLKRYPSLIQEFENDMKDDNLPSVSFIIAPTRKSEHATNHPCAGEDFTARVLKALESYPDVYKSSAFILNYDEGGQFFDHFWTPTPPLGTNTNKGISTVTVEGEINSNVLASEPSPIGLGFRVPLLIVSPWTRGNIVISEVYDHTSVIKLIEARFKIFNPNISPWRDIECRTLPDPVIPAVQSYPVQEQGVRVARALPYSFIHSDAVKVIDNTFKLTITNNGMSGAPFVLYDILNLATINPYNYAIESKKSISDEFSIDSSFVYQYSLLGPNGFAREMYGNVNKQDNNGASCSFANAQLIYEQFSSLSSSVTLTLSNNDNKPSAATMEFTIIDNAYDLISSPIIMKVNPNEMQSNSFDLKTSHNWYDFSVFLTSSSSSQPSQGSVDMSCYYRRFMGHVENGLDSITDPAMGYGNALVNGLRSQPEMMTDRQHPVLPALITHGVKRTETPFAKRDKDAQFYYIIDHSSSSEDLL
eukprot:gene11333-15197_t